MNTIFRYLRSEFRSEKNYSLVNNFLTELQNGGLNELQFAGCLAIDLKNGLLNKTRYANIIVSFMKSTKKVDLPSYQRYLDTSSGMKTYMSSVSCKNKRTQYVRVLRKEVFDRYYGRGHLYKTRLRSIGDEYEIDGFKVKRNGWTGYKDIVWITPYTDFIKVLNTFPHNPYRTNAICDFVGFPRDKFSVKTGSPMFGGVEIFIYIKYPGDFPEMLYQPNSTNANWGDENILYMSYSKRDGNGRTYNTNSIKFAKERVHCKCFYWRDKAFSAYEIGQPTYSTTNKSNILKEIKRRFRL